MKFFKDRYLLLAIVIGVAGAFVMDLSATQVDYLAVVTDPKLLAIGAAILLLFSQYNRSNLDHMRAYIGTLEKELTSVRSSLNEALKKIETMNTQLTYMETLVKRECPFYECDPQSGGCVHCERRLAYGRQSFSNTP